MLLNSLTQILLIQYLQKLKTSLHIKKNDILLHTIPESKT